MTDSAATSAQEIELRDVFEPIGEISGWLPTVTLYLPSTTGSNVETVDGHLVGDVFEAFDFGYELAANSSATETIPTHVVERFHALASQWKEETFVDSGANVYWNSAYQRIIGMGPTVLPLILDDLKSDPSDWFWALYAIVGQDIAERATTFDEAREAWLAWYARES